MSLAGTTLFITGASRGIGLAIALRAARDGANIAIAAKTEAPHPKLPGTIHTAAAEIEAAGGHALPLAVDIRDEAAVKAAIEQAAAHFGGLDIVVNNAGNNRRNIFADTTLDDLRNVLDVHLIGTFLVTQAAWPMLAARGSGRIVFTTSQVGFYGKVDSVAYGAAKMGLVGLMHGLRLSAEPLGIKVNCISPFALTRLGDIFPKDIADFIDPAQVAAAVALLASAQCPVSGEIVIAGGGHFATARTLESRGIDIDDPANVSAEAIAARWAEIADLRDPLLYPDALAAVGATFARVKALAAKA